MLLPQKDDKADDSTLDAVDHLKKLYPEDYTTGGGSMLFSGATSFAELDIIEEQRETQEEFRDLINKFMCLGENILSKPFGDKKFALQNLAYEFYTRVNDMSSGDDGEDDVEKAVWTGAYINDLPDSSFLYIESGGKKDSDGKTEPRSLRHLPYKDSSGKVDLPHLRNAIARAAQVKLKDGSKISEDLASRLQSKAQKILDNMKTEKMWLSGIEKEYDDEKHLIYGIVLNPGIVDSQDDVTDETEIEKAAHEFFMKSRILDHQHKVTLDPSVATPVESYIAPTNFMIGKKLVKKGAWVMVTKVFDNEIWKQIKNGDILSYSIVGYGRREPIEIDD